MKLAFLISAHTDPKHLLKLIESLPDESEFFIHVDAKSDIHQFIGTITDQRVHFISHRTDVVWGSLIEVEYQMELIRSCLHSAVAFDYIFTISGMDYPLWSNNRIISFLKNNHEKEFIQGISMENQGEASEIYRHYRPYNCRHWKNGSLNSKFRVILRHVIYAIGIHKPLYFNANGKRYALYKGSSWWAITSALAQYILNEYDTNKKLVNYFKTSFGPAETLIQTIVFNSEYAKRCILTKGKYTTLASLTPLHYIYYRPQIKIFTEDDYNALIASDKMFCRKVISGKSDKLMEIIDKNRL